MSIRKIPDFNDDFEMAWKRPGHVMPVPSLQYLFHFEGEMGIFRQPQSGNRSRILVARKQQLCSREVDSLGPGSEDTSYLVVEVCAPLVQMQEGASSDMYAAWEAVVAPMSNHQDKYIPCLKISYHLQTDDKAIIYLNSVGAKTEKREILGGQPKRDDSHDTPVSYEMRLRFTAKTDSPAYTWINDAIIVGCAVKIEDMLLYDAYKLD
jgi:Protein of unknown function (DUF3237)